jgi:hypothetical protein
VTPSTTVNGKFAVKKFAAYKVAVINFKLNAGVITMDPTPQTIDITEVIGGIDKAVLGVKYETTGAIVKNVNGFVVPYKETRTILSGTDIGTGTITYTKK